MTTKQLVDPRTPEGRMTLRYRGYRTEVILRELGLAPEDETREHRPREELIAQLVAIKLSPASKLAPANLPR